MGELRRYLINLVKGAVASKFRVKEPVLNICFPLNTYKSTLGGVNGGSSIANSRL